MWDMYLEGVALHAHVHTRTHTMLYWPVSELGAPGEEGFLWCRFGGVEPEEGMVLHAGLPQVLARAVTHHVEADQIVNVIVLKIEQRSMN